MGKFNLFLNRNASTILTIVGTAGVLITTALAVKATPKAIKLLDAAKEEKGEDLTKLEIAKTAAPAYIPTAISGAATITCVFGANVLNKRQQASLASAYALLSHSYQEYESKIRETCGLEADAKAKTEIAKGHISEDEMRVGSEKLFFFDNQSLRMFESTIEEVLQAEDKINNLLSDCGSVSLNDFYDLVGLPRTDYGYEIGWSVPILSEFNQDSRIEFEHEKLELDGGNEGYLIVMHTPPVVNYLY